MQVHPPHVDPATRGAIVFEHAHPRINYDPLPVVIANGQGAWVTDIEGRRYLDFLAAYSALNFGHGHPALIEAASAQLGRLTLTSRAFSNDQLGPFAAALAELAGKELVVDEHRRRGRRDRHQGGQGLAYRVKGVPQDAASIIVARGNFHGRTTTIVGFSDDPGAHDDFGPYGPGFVSVPFGDADALPRRSPPTRLRC